MLSAQKKSQSKKVVSSSSSKSRKSSTVSSSKEILKATGSSVHLPRHQTRLSFILSPDDVFSGDSSVSLATDLEELISLAKSIQLCFVGGEYVLSGEGEKTDKGNEEEEADKGNEEEEVDKGNEVEEADKRNEEEDMCSEEGENEERIRVKRRMKVMKYVANRMSNILVDRGR